jgi:hypothetical protein
MREVGKSGAPLFSEKDIQYVLQMTDVDKVLAFSTPQPVR